MLLFHAVVHPSHEFYVHLWMTEGGTVLQMPSQAAESMVAVALAPAAEPEQRDLPDNASGAFHSHLPKSSQ